MAQRPKTVKQAIEDQRPHSDGRRERSRASRRKIIQAMMDLISEGDINPSAAKVAERAGVGLRSVFRHFDDKDSIYLEMDQILWDAYQPEFEAPYQSDRWQDRLVELIERRARVYEAIAPFRIATSIQRFNSPALTETYRRLLKAEHESLAEIMPGTIGKDSHRARAILLATSFDTWRLFRQDEELSADKTVAVITQLLRDIFDQIDG